MGSIKTIIIGTLSEPIPPKYYGGIEEIIYFIVEGLLKKGWYIYLIDIDDDFRRDLTKFGKITRNDKFKMVRIPVIASTRNTILMLRGLVALAKTINLIKKDSTIIVHSFYYYPLFPLTLFLKFLSKIEHSNIKVIYTTAAHYPWLARQVKFRSKLTYPFRKLMKDYADIIVTLSEPMVKSISLNLNIPKNKFRVIHDCYDDEEYDYRNIEIQKLQKMAENFKKNTGLKDKLIILYLARLQSEKGIDDLLQALELLKSLCSHNFHRLKVIIAGKTNDKTLQKYKSMIKRKNLDNVVTIVGNKPRIVVKFLYTLADLYILPTKLEAGPPISLLQAIGSGTPAITTKYSLIPELLRLSHSVIDKPIAKNLARKIYYFLIHKQELRMMWEKEYIIVKKYYGKSYCVSKYLEVYV
ncbi:MAG: glycosyltransferase family 4 protein [Desulfurococcales archaeon]|nr:glycosyltransferase family 4 protein [Desulfurococcales archaeon]